MKQPKARILVVEDDPAILNGLLDLLVFNGYGTDGIADGGKGLKAALDRAYDLILLDVMLPTMDGFTICKEIRAKKPNRPLS
jgi:two-component system response regulator RegX3